jgi:hypothetical protein
VQVSEAEERLRASKISNQSCMATATNSLTRTYVRTFVQVSEAEERLRSSKISYEELVATMTEELNRWQKERAADMAALLRDFALAQVRTWQLQDALGVCIRYRAGC